MERILTHVVSAAARGAAAALGDGNPAPGSRHRGAGRCTQTPELYLPAGRVPRPPWAQGTCVAYIICEPCIGTKDSACVDVCPVDCIHPRKDEPDFAAAEMLYVHPDECIDCGACVPACPVEAIFALDETPQKWESFIRVNAQYYQT